MSKSLPKMKFGHFALTTIIDVCAFLVGYYSLFWHPIINWRFLFMSICAIALNRFLIKAFKDDAKNSQTQEELQTTIAPLPLDETHSINETVSNSYSSVKPTLILSFHGVMHRNQNETLEFKGRIIEIIDSVPGIQIIISSDWRTDCDEPWLRNKLGDDIFSKVVGYTPVSLDRNKSVEINQFLDHKLPRKFVVLDAEQLESSHVNGLFIRTESYIGIEDKHVTRAIDFLS
ncbi:HAD domain-containing protein [Vibrio sp. Makdt]|uniref:HAD domain-containing protein n=1 Tax=Vibrio sp. Makdt TaxID=2998828 RepID=UPI0022CD58E4|nr:HAD domain-containing protein [Vibrio sp. Makdt]MDA0152430.1 HAD domain-containing protein [Vibrio sp. Makdt]